MSGAHKATLRIYGEHGAWIDDCVVYLTDEGRSRFIAALKAAGLDPVSTNVNDRAVVILGLAY